MSPDHPGCQCARDHYFNPGRDFIYETLILTHYLRGMEVNDALVQKLAKLARLRFSESERAAIREDLHRMIGFVEKLNELDLENVKPLLHMSGELNILREDLVQGSVSREEGLKNAPVHDDQFFKVPKVIRK